MVHLKDYIKDNKVWPLLTSLDVSQNMLLDSGVVELANGLMERFKASQKQRDSQFVKLPLLDLNIKQTEMSDLGFKQLLQRFESMHQTIQKSNLQIEQ
jgi:hypothetical protein